MNRSALSRAALVVLVALPLPVLGCGEGMFMAGKGLQFQSYLAPRPATVLIYAPNSDGERQEIHAGLEKAGHQLTVVADEGDLQRALSSSRYDVLIADLDRLEALGAAASSTRILPVVPRDKRRSDEVRSRFERFVLDGASLGQHLSAIDELVAMN